MLGGTSAPDWCMCSLSSCPCTCMAMKSQYMHLVQSVLESCTSMPCQCTYHRQACPEHIYRLSVNGDPHHHRSLHCPLSRTRFPDLGSVNTLQLWIGLACLNALQYKFWRETSCSALRCTNKPGDAGQPLGTHCSTDSFFRISTAIQSQLVARS